jgi:hypothetical protein
MEHDAAGPVRDHSRAAGVLPAGAGGAADRDNDQDAFLSVSWQTAERRREQRSLTEEEVADLGGGSPGVGPLSALLSGLGRELDQAEIEVSRIFHEADSFVVSGVSHGRYVNRRFASWELGHRSGAGQPYGSLPSPRPVPPPLTHPRSLPGAAQGASLTAMSAPGASLRRRLGLQ